MLKKAENKKIILGWCMYDWANSAFATTMMASVLPIFYSQIGANGLSKIQATSYWGYTNTIAMLIIAFSTPILGSMADYSRKRKIYLLIFASIGIMATCLLTFSGQGQWLFISILYIVGRIGFGGGNVFYDSLLPYIAKEGDIDQISVLGYALGYLGGGLLLSLNVAMILRPGFFGIPGKEWGMRLSFLSVSLWWAVFSLPLLLNVPEPEEILFETSQPEKIFHADTFRDLVKKSFRGTLDTFRHIMNYKEVFKFLLAFWLYSDGIGTVIIMAAIFGSEIGIEDTHLIGAILLVQFLSFPFSLLFGKLSKVITTKRCILVGLFTYLVISVLGYFLAIPLHFWSLAILVGMVQGGTQALSRSFFGRMVPFDQSAKFFSFYDISAKFAGIIGPAFFGLIAQAFGSSRYGVFSLIFFFMAGGIMLYFVKSPSRK